jgi:proteasome accessory factor B
LCALVDELRARSPRPVRAAELAERFEISTRTIERDLLTLE